MGVDNPLSDWVPESVWGSVQALHELEDYASLPDDLVGSSKRWREWMELERPGGGRLWLWHHILRFCPRIQACMLGWKNLRPQRRSEREGTHLPADLSANCATSERTPRRAPTQRMSPSPATGSACPSLSACCSSARCAPTA